MADNVKVNPATGSIKHKADKNADDEYTVYWKLADGTADSDTVIESGNGAAANALRVTPASDSTGKVKLKEGAATVGEAEIGAASTGLNDLGAAEDQAFKNGKGGISGLSVRGDTPANKAADGDYEPVQVSGGKVWRRAEGNVADDSASTARPVGLGGVSVETDGTSPGSVAEGDAGQLRADLNKRLLVNKAGPWNVKGSATGSTADTTEVMAAPSESRLHLTDVTLSAGGAQSFDIVENTSSPTTVAETIYVPANGTVRKSFKTPIRLSANVNAGVTTSAAQNWSATFGGFATSESIDLTVGLAHWWDLDETGSADRVDSVGADNFTATGSPGTGTINGVTALDLDGSTQYLSRSKTGTAADGAGSFAFCLWVNGDTLAADSYIFAKPTPGGTVSSMDWRLRYQNSANTFGWAVYQSGSGTNVNWSSTVSTGTDYFIYCYYDDPNDEIGISVNNGTIATTAAAVTLGNVGTVLSVGRYNNATPNLFDGKIGSIAFYSTIPTAAMVTKLYNSGTPLQYADL